MPFTFCMIRHIICTSRSLNVENLLLTIERHRIFDHWDSHHKQCALCSFKHTISTVCVVSWIIRTDIGWNKKLTNMTSVFLFVCFFLCIALRMLLFIHRNKKGIKMTEKTIVAVLCLAWYVIRKRQLPPSRCICRLRCVVGHLTLGAIHRAFVCSIRIWCVLCFFLYITNTLEKSHSFVSVLIWNVATQRSYSFHSTFGIGTADKTNFLPYTLHVYDN